MKVLDNAYFTNEQLHLKYFVRVTECGKLLLHICCIDPSKQLLENITIWLGQTHRDYQQLFLCTFSLSKQNFEETFVLYFWITSKWFQGIIKRNYEKLWNTKINNQSSFICFDSCAQGWTFFFIIITASFLT